MERNFKNVKYTIDYMPDLKAYIAVFNGEIKEPDYEYIKPFCADVRFLDKMKTRYLILDFDKVECYGDAVFVLWGLCGNVIADLRDREVKNLQEFIYLFSSLETVKKKIKLGKFFNLMTVKKTFNEISEIIKLRV